MSLTQSEIQQLIAAEVTHYAERSHARGKPGIPDIDDAVLAVADKLSGYGALQPLLDDPTIEEIWINAPDCLFVARNGTAERLDRSVSETEIHRIVERMLWQAGRRVDALC
jgi:pilus assembly protein CpaF